MAPNNSVKDDSPLVVTNDIEAASNEPIKETAPTGNSIVVNDFESYPGADLAEKIDSLIDLHAIVVISKSTCPFCRDVKDLLINTIGVTVHSVEVNLHPEGSKIFAYAKAKTGRSTVPLVFIKGEFIGGCDDTKGLHHKDKLEPLLKGLVHKSHVAGTDRLETARLLPTDRGFAMNPFFWCTYVQGIENGVQDPKEKIFVMVLRQHSR